MSDSLLDSGILLLPPDAAPGIRKANFEELEQKANAGNPVAQTLLAEFYLFGLGVVEINAEKAFHLYTHALDTAGLPQAAIGLGWSHVRQYATPLRAKKATKYFSMFARHSNSFNENSGLHLKFCLASFLESGPKAEKLLNEAASKGHMLAFCEIARPGIISKKNWKGVEKDVSRLIQAAEQNHAEAQFLVGICFLDGIGVSKNVERGMFWLRAGAKQGHNPSHMVTATMLVEMSLYEEAVFHTMKAANQGHPSSMFFAGVCLLAGKGMDRDEKKAVEFLLEAALSDVPGAKCMLGLCYYEGSGVTKDFFKSAELFSQAHEEGDIDGTFRLALAYYSGEGVSKNVARAVQLCTEASTKGHLEATYRLGGWYLVGDAGLEMDKVKGIEYLSHAANKGFFQAAYSLSKIYIDGEGVAVDIPKGVELCRKAAEGGHDEAQYSLGTFYVNGIGHLPVDVSLGLSWLLDSSKQGFKLSSQTIKQIKEDYPPEEFKILLTEAQRIQSTRAETLRQQLQQQQSQQHSNLSQFSSSFPLFLVGTSIAVGVIIGLVLVRNLWK